MFILILGYKSTEILLFKEYLVINGDAAGIESTRNPHTIH